MGIFCFVMRRRDARRRSSVIGELRFDGGVVEEIFVTVRVVWRGADGRVRTMEGCCIGVEEAFAWDALADRPVARKMTFMGHAGEHVRALVDVDAENYRVCSTS